MTCGIYGIFNTANGKVLVGQSNDLQRRWKCEHLTALRRNAHYNSYFQAAYNKYGEQAFELRILEEASEAILNIREIAWIAHYKSANPTFGYNLCSGGGGVRGRKHTAEELAKMSAAWLHRAPVSEATKAKISASNLGKNLGKRHSDEVRARISVACRGKKKSPRSLEHCAKISANNRNKVVSQATKDKIRKARLGTRLSFETRAKQSESHRKIHSLIYGQP